MQSEDRVRIRHMIEACETVEEFMAGRGREELDHDRLLAFAVVRAVEIIGEAAGRVSQETRVSTPSIPWTSIVGMRNRLIHGYFDVDGERVWKTATEEVPALLLELRRVIGDSPRQEEGSPP